MIMNFNIKKLYLNFIIKYNNNNYSSYNLNILIKLKIKNN